MSASRNSQLRFSAVLPVVVALLAASIHPAFGGEAPPSDADAPPAFRRIFAPGDRKQDWPFRAERYLPIEAEEFERAVKAAAGSTHPPANTAVVAADLVARFDVRNRLVGRAEITVKPSTAGPQLVPLTDGGSILTNCTWKNGKRTAIVGSTADGRTAVWVESPGVLVAEWMLVGRGDDAGGVSFDFDLPAAPTSQLRLTLPEGYELRSTTLARDATKRIADEETEETLRAVAGRGRLRIVAVEKAASLRRPTVRQDSTYEYSERGIEMAVQLRIDAVGEPLERLELDVDPALTIVDVRLPDRRPAWTETAAVKSQPRRISVEFDPPLFGTNRTVLVRGLAAAQLGKRQALPTIQCPKLDWLQGTVSLAVAAPLVVDRLDPILCAADVPQPLAGARTGEAIGFTCFDPQASVRVLISRVRDHLDVAGLTTVAFGKEETTAEYRAELRVTGGERFLLQAAVPTRWIVDSVSTVPPGIVNDWTLSEVRDGRRWLTLRLAEAFKPNQPLRLTIAARTRRTTLGTSIEPEALRIAEFRDARVDVATAAVRADDAWRLELDRAADDASPSLDQLDPLRRELLGDFRAQQLLDLRPTAAPWTMKLERRAPRIEADSQVVATFTGDSLREKYTIRLTNRDDRPVDRVLVRFYPPRQTPLSWSLENDRRGRLDARRTFEKSGEEIVGETWEVVFQSPADDELVLEAVRRSDWESLAEVSLPSVVDAGTQQGLVTIESDAVTPIAVDRALLTSVSIDRPTERRRLIRGEYRFDAEQAVNRDVPGRPSVRRLPLVEGPIAAVVWNAAIRTSYESDERMLHRVQLRIQSFGGESFRWNFPLDARRLVVEAGGNATKTNENSIAVTGSTVDVPLPGRSEFVVVTAEYETSPNRSGPFRLVETPTLDLNLPVLHFDRKIVLPKQWTIASGEVVDSAGRPISSLAEAIAPLLRFGISDENAPNSRGPEVGEAAARKAAAKFWRGDSAVEVRGVSPTTATIWIVRRESLWAAAFASAALAAGLGFRFFARRRRGAVILVAWLVVGMLIPNAVTVLCLYGLLGLGAAWCAELVLPGLFDLRKKSTRAKLGTQEPSAAIGSTTRRTAATSVVLAVLLANDAGLSAQSTTEPRDDGMRPVPAVFIPVDDQGKPTGERFLVPQRLWQALVTAGPKQSEVAAGGVLIADAQYEISIVQDARRGFHIPTEIRGVWNLFAATAQGEAAIVFPDFGGASAAVLLDGRPADAVRAADGRRWLVAVEKAGAHRLEIILRPPVDAPFERGGIEFAVPRVPDSRLRLNVPPDLAALQVRDAADAPVVSDDRRSVETILQPNERISLTWSEGATTGSAAEFDQYEWWRIRPGTVTVDVRLRVTSKFASGREITLVADPRLQWIPRRSADGDSPEVFATPIVVEQANVGQRLRVELPKPLQPDTVVETSFLLNGASGVGRLRLPELRLETLPAKRRFVAVSVDPSFDHSAQGTSGIVATAIPEFEKLWGATTSSPQLAFERNAPHDDWQLSTRPKPTRLTATETETLVCGRARVDVAYEAEASISGDAATRHDISAPPELEVDSVSVVDADGEEQLLRWSRDDLGAVCLFLRTAQRASHRIVMQGSISLADSAETPFPFIGLRGATGTRTFRIVRLPDASVSIRELKQLREESVGSIGESLGGRGRLERILRAVGTTPSAKLKIGENAPKTTARIASTLRRDAQNWEFETVVQMNVAGGSLDEIRLDFPAEIATPVTITPAMPYEVAGDANGSQRALVLLPREPVRGEFQFALRAKVPTVDPTHGMPVVRLRGAAAAEHFFLLPARSGLNRVGWDVRQMAPAELPEGFSKPLSEEVLIYRAVGPEPKAALRDVRRSAGAAFVRLADHFVRLDPSGDVGVSNWLVEPAGASEFRLRLPSGASLLHLRVGGADVVPTFAGDAGEVRFTSSSEQMPHLVEVAYRSTDVAVGRSPRVIHAPELVGPTVDRTIWTVERADGDASIAANESSTVPQWRAQMDRARAWDAVLLEFAADESLGIAGRWADSVAARRRRLKAEMETSLRPTDEAERREWEAIVGREIAVGATKSGDDSLDRRPVDLDAVWDAAAMHRGGRTYWSNAGAMLSTTVDEPIGRAWVFDEAGILATATVVLWAIAFLLRRCDGWMRWSRVLGLAVASLACTWGQPPAVGWAVVVVLVACELHGSLRYARESRPSLFTALRPQR